MADPTRPRVSLKAGAAERNPQRKAVRPGAPPRPADPQRPRPPNAQPGPPRDPRAPPPARPAPRTPPRPTPAPVAQKPRARPEPRPTPAPVERTPDGVRVSKLMTERGLASRRESDEWIEAGWVKVDGRTATLGQRVAPTAVITVDPRASAEQSRRVTVLLNKPIGYVSGQAEDGHEPAIVLVRAANRWPGDDSRIEHHGGHLRSLAPAGRLDIDSTGLLVLTQDGRIAKLLVGDQTRVEKEYLVRVRHLREGPVPESALDKMRHGLELDGVALRPARVSWQNEEQLRVVLREGRKRQIRRMCELVGLEVLGLRRVRIGSVPLGPLPVGQWRYLRDDERF